MTEYTPTHDDIVLGKIHLGDNFWRELSEDEVRRGLNEIQAEAWDEGHGFPCDEWAYSEMCRKYHPNPHRNRVE